MTPTRRRGLLPLLGLLVLVPLLHAPAAHADGTASTEPVSISSTSVPQDDDDPPHWARPASISDDGRYVAFTSRATNLVPDDTNGTVDVFVRDRQAGTTERINLHPDGGESSEEAYMPVISGDGTTVVFVSSDLDLTASTGESDVAHLYRWTRSTGDLELVTTTADGDSIAPAVSDDGRYVAFASQATNLVAGTDDNGAGSDVYRKDMDTGTVVRVSVSTSGTQLPGGVNPLISDDGNQVLFDGFHSGHHYDLRDITAGTTIDAAPGHTPNSGEDPGFSGDGSLLSFRVQDIHSQWSLYVTAPGGTATEVVGPTSAVQLGTLSDDGRYLAFATGDALVGEDSDNGAYDVYRMDLQDSSVRFVSQPPATDVATYAIISGGGQHVLFYAEHPDFSDDANWYIRGSLADPDPSEETTTTTTTVDPAACQWEWGGLQEPDPQPCHDSEEISLSSGERAPDDPRQGAAVVALALLTVVGWNVLKVTAKRSS